MSNLFNAPDEYVQGCFKSGQALLQAFTGVGSGSNLARVVANHWERQAALWSRTLVAGAGNDVQPVVAAEAGDRRFHGGQWTSHPWFSLLKQNYLLYAQLLDGMVEAADV